MLGMERLQLREHRAQAGVAASALAVVIAFAAALLTAPGEAGLVKGVQDVSFAGEAALRDVASVLSLGYAFALGMVAAVNPCGFALLPAYLGFYLGEGAGQRGGSRGVTRAVQVSVMVTAGFILIFGVVGLLLSLVSSAVALYFPLIGLLVGLALVVAGGRLLAGGAVRADLAERFAGRLGSSTRRASGRGYLAYGVAYGAASLGCTLPLFMVVVVVPLTQGGFLQGALQFVLYALGMGAVVTALTLSIALFKQAAVSRVARLGRYVQALSPALLLVAGAYVMYYWLTQGGLLDTFR